MNGLFVVGDSISDQCAAASPASAGWVPQLVAATGRTLTKWAVSGSQAADQAIKAHDASLAADDIGVVLIGTNDVPRYGPLYKAFLLDILTQMAAPGRVRLRDSGMALVGTWTDSQPAFCRGKWSYTPGNTATATVSGTAVYISLMLEDDYSGTPVDGKAEVFIDSVSFGIIGTRASGMTTHNGAAWAPASFRFGGLAPGAHQVQLKIIAGNPMSVAGVMYGEGITGSDQLVKPRIFVSKVPRYGAAGYTALGGSDAVVAQINADIDAAVAQLVGDGLNVATFDGALDPTVDLSPVDWVHPVNSGHTKQFSAGNLAISGPVVVPPPPVYVDVTAKRDQAGAFWLPLADGTLKRLVTA